MKRYEIEVFIDDVPTYMVDVPARRSDSAERYAKVAVMQQHRQMDIGRINTRWTGKTEEL